jgi:AcrR family transcriptional regulator
MTNVAHSTTANRILDTAIEVIDQDGLFGLRVMEISKRADVAIPLIYRHFGSRNGLIAAALETMYARLLADEFQRFASIAETTCFRTIGDLMDFLSPSNDPVRAAQCRVRLMVLSAANELPDLKSKVVALQAEMSARTVALIEKSLVKGEGSVGLEPRALNLLMQSVVSGMAINDIAGFDHLTNDEFHQFWSAVV